MKADQVADKYQYSLPYSRQDILDIYAEGYRQAIADVLRLSNGEVINGVLKGMIDSNEVQELVKCIE